MTPEEWTLIRGVLKKGYGVASGPSPDYPYGALQQQLPIFKSRGLDLLAYFRGTLNIDIRSFTFQLDMPEYTFRDVHWTDLHPPEHFSFAARGDRLLHPGYPRRPNHRGAHQFA
jgi:hypothetical protein